MSAPIQVNTPLFQVSGGQTYQLNIETTASQVKCSDGMDIETRLQTVERAASGAAVVHFADDIAGRDALTGVNTGDTVIVADATGDATVGSGGARYVKLSDGSFRKTSEDESMDVVCTWEHIENRPASTVAQIDLAVAKQHTHDNIETLAHISEDGTGKLLYKGRAISDGLVWVARVDSIDEIPFNLAEGGLVFLNAPAEDEGGED